MTDLHLGIVEESSFDAGVDPLSNSRVSFDGYFTRERPPAEFLVEPLLVRGRLHSVVAQAKTGKSLLMLEVAASLATGRDVLQRRNQEPVSVMYLDAEMTDDDLLERLVDMGFSEEDEDLLDANLHYYLLPNLPPLDGPEGGHLLSQAVEDVSPALVVIDTTGRYVSGDENSNDTWQDWYRYTGQRLKAFGVTVVRLDHLGKDTSKGARGGSAKRDDVDVQWTLTADSPRVTLKTHGTSRLSWVRSRVELERHSDPLRHVLTNQRQLSHDEARFVETLDRHDVARDIGRPTTIKEINRLKDSGLLTADDLEALTLSTASMQEAVNFRKRAANAGGYAFELEPPGQKAPEHARGTPEPAQRESPAVTERTTGEDSQEHHDSAHGNSSLPLGGNSSQPDACVECAQPRNKLGACTNESCHYFGWSPESVERRESRFR